MARNQYERDLETHRPAVLRRMQDAINQWNWSGHRRQHGEELLLDMVIKHMEDKNAFTVNTPTINKMAAIIQRKYTAGEYKWFDKPPASTLRPQDKDGKPHPVSTPGQQSSSGSGSQRQRTNTGARRATLVPTLNCPMRSGSNARPEDPYSEQDLTTSIGKRKRVDDDPSLSQRDKKRINGDPFLYKDDLDHLNNLYGKPKAKTSMISALDKATASIPRPNFNQRGFNIQPADVPHQVHPDLLMDPQPITDNFNEMEAWLMEPMPVLHPPHEGEPGQPQRRHIDDITGKGDYKITRNLKSKAKRGLQWKGKEKTFPYLRPKKPQPRYMRPSQPKVKKEKPVKPAKSEKPKVIPKSTAMDHALHQAKRIMNDKIRKGNIHPPKLFRSYINVRAPNGQPQFLGRPGTEYTANEQTQNWANYAHQMGSTALDSIYDIASGELQRTAANYVINTLPGHLLTGATTVAAMASPVIYNAASASRGNVRRMWRRLNF